MEAGHCPLYPAGIAQEAGNRRCPALPWRGQGWSVQFFGVKDKERERQIQKGVLRASLLCGHIKARHASHPFPPPISFRIFWGTQRSRAGVCWASPEAHSPGRVMLARCHHSAGRGIVAQGCAPARNPAHFIRTVTVS